LVVNISNALKILLCVFFLAGCSESSNRAAQVSDPGIDVQAELAACDSHLLTAQSTILANGWTLNSNSTRHQEASKAMLNASTVGELELQWSFVFVGDEERRGHPVVTTEAVILGSPAGTVRALGRSTGCDIWSFQAEAQVRTAAVLGDDPASDGRLLYFGDTLANVYAIDAESGSPVWQQQVDQHPDAIITGSPQLIDQQLLVPISSLEVRTAANPGYVCCSFRGGVVSLDAATGQENWRYRTIKEAAVLNPATGKLGPSGAPVWAVPTVDVVRNLVYIGTGENYSQPSTDTSDAIIAIDLSTGEERWKLQGTENDVWNISCLLPAPFNGNCPPDPGPDLDFGAAPVLVVREGKADILLAAQKSGAIYALVPDSGAILWQRNLGSGGNLGGVHWGVATDENNVYVPISDIQSRELTLADIADLDNAATIFQPDGAEPGLYALNLDTGVTEWFTQPVRMTPLSEQRPVILSAAVTLANNLLYTAGLDGIVRIYDSVSGALLRELDTTISVEGVNGESGNGGTIDSGGPVVAGGMLYINSGYTTFGRDPTWFAGPGNALMAFGSSP
jgi:polyvinyl alcohol dehydrogenase (cytochrome)